jgi:hypothetical protein
MKIRPIYPAALAILLPLGICFDYILFIMFAGFPDNFMSQQEAANLRVLIAFNWFCIALAVWFAALTIVGRKRDIARPFLWGCAAFATATVFALAITAWNVTNLVDSAGG